MAVKLSSASLLFAKVFSQNYLQKEIGTTFLKGQIGILSLHRESKALESTYSSN